MFEIAAEKAHMRTLAKVRFAPLAEVTIIPMLREI